MPAPYDFAESELLSPSLVAKHDLYAGELYCFGCDRYIEHVNHFRDGYCEKCWTCQHENHEEDEPCEDIYGKPVVTEGVA